MEDPPKKRRKLLIIDVEGDGTESVAPTMPMAPPRPPEPAIDGPGPVHARVQREVLEMCKKARCEPFEVEDYIWIKVDKLLAAKTRDEAEKMSRGILESLSIPFILMTKHPERQAKSAERLAKMWRNKGEDGKADAQLAKAKKIRAEMAAEKEG